MPQGAANEGSLRYGLSEVQRSLARHGAGQAVSVGTYPAPNHQDAAPIRLSFRALRAQVANKCGEWPTDLASAGSLESWENRPYWDYGCSYQNMLAQQVADPRDFVAPRAEAPVDVEMRLRGIKAVRSGGDPTTGWSVTVGGVGG
jgi:pilus assembly protein CpaD